MRHYLSRAWLIAAILGSGFYLAAQDAVPALKDSLGGLFAIGAAAQPNFVEAADRHSAILARHFNAIAAENVMKPEALQPSEGVFRFTSADKIVRFAERNGMLVRGHTLLWHQQTPLWFFSDPEAPSKKASPELLLAREKAHIQTVVAHYRGRVAAWDVVNEVLNDDGSLRSAAGGSKWFDILGPDYIDKAFEYAREVDPAALLVINDYNLESVPVKRDAMCDLVKAMLGRGVPVGGIGMQMHVSIYGPSIYEIRQAIERFAALGVKVQVTELDVSLYRGSEKEVPITPELLERQARRYGELFDLFREEAAKGELDMVVLWGVSDESSWLNNFPVSGRTNAPLLFDKDLEPKPAFWALMGGKK